MEQLLWSFEDVKRFIDHPETPLRRWALERLTRLFPKQAGEVLVARLEDPNTYILSRTLDFLAETGDAETYGPILLERLQQAEGERFGRVASALAKLNYRPALPLILANIDGRDNRPINFFHDKFLYLVHALGKFGGTEARQTLWGLLERKISTDDYVVTSLMDALLEAAQPADIPRLAQHYRTLPLEERGRTPLAAFAASVRAGRLVDEMTYEVDQGLEAILDRAKRWLNADLQVSETCLDDLEHAFDHKYAGVFEILRSEARRLVAERGDDIAGWQATWAAGERPAGYRRRALYTLHTLEAFAGLPQTFVRRRAQESLMGLGLLLQLSIDQDDQAWLEAATDKTEALLAILAEPREHVLPDIVERVAALGPEIAPRLIDLLDPEDFGWGAIRIAHTIERIARLHPGSCDAAIPKLIETIHDEQGDYLKEAASDALEAIGAPAVELILQHLRSARDLSRQIYLTGVLGQIPVESASEIILDKIRAGQPIEEFELTILSDIGSPAAIEPLSQLWKPGDALLAEQLLILCELNGVQKPELPEWRRLVKADEERLEKILEGDFDLLEGLKNLANPERPLIRTWQLEPEQPKDSSSGRKKTLSKKEQKKRAAQRKGTKGKKKRRR